MTASPPRAGQSRRFALVCVVAVALAVGAGWAVGKFRSRGSAPVGQPVANSASQRGEFVFVAHCASCHGPEGRGDGPSAAALRQPPHDFAARPWRLAVTRDAIRAAILDGIPGTAMPASRAALAPDDVEALVNHVYHLATLPVPDMHGPTEGEKLLQQAGFTDLNGIDPPALILADANGKELRLAHLKGQTVLVHFWGIGCVHCLKEMPRIKEMETRFADRPFTVLHVCTDADDIKQAHVAASRAVPGLRVFEDASGIGLARFEVQTLPTIWLIGPDGRAIGRASGSRDWNSPAFVRLIESHLPAR